MRNSYLTTLLSFGVAIASLSSCSRATYSFNNAAPAYLGTTHARASAPVAAPNTAEAIAVEAPSATPAAALPVQAATVALAAPVKVRVAHRPAHVAAASTETVSARPAVTKADRKEMKQALRQIIKQKKATSPSRISAEGKSQLVAALLCFFLGGIGVHDFYLGYIGKGILQIFLTLLFGLGIILVIIDLIRILTGSLKPKNGDYASKL
ncbi:TM2 domain-containing protein [Hymenobacter rubidus]|uniref:TM2 domain-containing protein n=1 Tax=Hymenobacter rubidus TaxID=1441626 RepID=UPI001F22CC9C|nr:TM2 domain-containing protein [Hymenobacter rubidus]